MERTEQETWDQSRDVVRTHGLPPNADTIPLIRTLLEQEMSFKAEAQEYPGHEYMRALCALLWANGDPEDAVRIAAAKFEDMDAGCMIDSEFLVCGDLDAARACLQRSDLQSSKAALHFLGDDTVWFQREDVLADERQRFGLSA
jgi:hypothetical protein